MVSVACYADSTLFLILHLECLFNLLPCEKLFTILTAILSHRLASFFQSYLLTYQPKRYHKMFTNGPLFDHQTTHSYLLAKRITWFTSTLIKHKYWNDPYILKIEAPFLVPVFCVTILLAFSS